MNRRPTAILKYELTPRVNIVQNRVNWEDSIPA
jgi:hypothetical protein